MKYSFEMTKMMEQEEKKKRKAYPCAGPIVACSTVMWLWNTPSLYLWSKQSSPYLAEASTVCTSVSVWGIPLTRKYTWLLAKPTGISTMLSSKQNVFFAAYYLPLCVLCCVLTRGNLSCFLKAPWRSLFSLRRSFYPPLALVVVGC